MIILHRSFFVKKNKKRNHCSAKLAKYIMVFHLSNSYILVLPFCLIVILYYIALDKKSRNPRIQREGNDGNES